MCNELGITRDDIERWTKEAVTIEVQKKLNGQLNIPDLVSKAIDNVVKAQLLTYGQPSDTVKQAVTKAVIQQVNQQILLTVEVKPKEIQDEKQYCSDGCAK
jgi:hypothetical protein